ncbi:caspase family protein [Microscilla marina]|uniref:Peptidase C14 caspase domain-containing protein n=1 Tax=Microscilla marina ATCC 23134 TaxID=313606 RepID=A1ZUN5_MICM2|nr:caspase family protein [Microscilla marina]EAY25921.1 conserved hypothetical protein, putative [Microscilla marina ATCC 23134]
MIKKSVFLICFFGAMLVLEEKANAQKKRKPKTIEVLTPKVTLDLGYLRKDDINATDFAFDAQAKNYLLLMACDKYKYWRPLNNPVKDAQDVKKVLLQKYGFQQENVFELMNEEVTAIKVEKAFDQLSELGNNRDNLIIYYSGHGHYDKKYDEGFWVPVDGRTSYQSSYIRNADITKYIKRLKFKHVFLIVDACFSGSLFVKGRRGYEEKVESLKSRWGFASGSLEFVSDGKKGENSPFAKHLLNYLRGSVQDKFPVSQLIQAVKVAVANNTKQVPVGRPLQGVGDAGGEFIFYNHQGKDHSKK